VFLFTEKSLDGLASPEPAHHVTSVAALPGPSASRPPTVSERGWFAPQAQEFGDAPASPTAKADFLPISREAARGPDREPFSQGIWSAGASSLWHMNSHSAKSGDGHAAVGD
jgi:hypothetical protein